LQILEAASKYNVNTLSRYNLNKVGDKLHPCVNPVVTLKPFVIRSLIFILELDPSYNAFIASINLVLIANVTQSIVTFPLYPLKLVIRLISEFAATIHARLGYMVVAVTDLVVAGHGCHLKHDLPTVTETLDHPVASGSAGCET
jgi:hypothetical protein